MVGKRRQGDFYLFPIRGSQLHHNHGIFLYGFSYHRILDLHRVDTVRGGYMDGLSLNGRLSPTGFSSLRIFLMAGGKGLPGGHVHRRC